MDGQIQAGAGSGRGINSLCLKLIAMAAMLTDHVGMVFFSQYNIFRIIGRIAMPIFVFQLIEGFFHTRDLKKYLLRLAVFAAISEIPFDLMLSGTVLYPRYQNVMITLFLGLSAVALTERIRTLREGARKESEPRVSSGRLLSSLRLPSLDPVFWLGAAAVSAVFSLIAEAAGCDYGAKGVMLAMAFYIFRGSVPLQLAGLYLIDWVWAGQNSRQIWLGSSPLHAPLSGFALLAIIPIALYNGRSGPASGISRYLLYAFYPLHMLAIGLLAMYL